MVDKGLVTPPLPRSKEQVQKELSQAEQPEQRATNEASKEGQIVKYSQSPPQDTKVQVSRSTKTEKIEGEPS